MSANISFKTIQINKDNKENHTNPQAFSVCVKQRTLQRQLACKQKNKHHFEMSYFLSSYQMFSRSKG